MKKRNANKVIGVAMRLAESRRDLWRGVRVVPLKSARDDGGISNFVIWFDERARERILNRRETKTRPQQSRAGGAVVGPLGEDYRGLGGWDYSHGVANGTQGWLRTSLMRRDSLHPPVCNHKKTRHLRYSRSKFLYRTEISRLFHSIEIYIYVNYSCTYRQLYSGTLGIQSLIFLDAATFESY